jgi:uncharacterized protein
MNEAVPPVSSIPPVATANASSRSWEVLCHLSGAAGLIGVPFGNVLGPLIVWLLKRDESPAIDDHGKESLNFHLSWTLWAVIYCVTALIATFFIVGIFMWLLLPVGWLAMAILIVVGSVKASNGELYRYPLTVRFLR